MDNFHVFIPYFALAIPIIAITGGIIHGIVRTVGRQRIAELAQRERIAAIERGIDPSKLPPILVPGLDPRDTYTFEQRQARTAQGLMIGGIITTAVGFGIGVPLIMLHETEGWIPGAVMLSVGLALIISSRLVRSPSSNGSGSSRP